MHGAGRWRGKIGRLELEGETGLERKIKDKATDPPCAFTCTLALTNGGLWGTRAPAAFTDQETGRVGRGHVARRSSSISLC